jgi:hypothetical protein
LTKWQTSAPGGASPPRQAEKVHKTVLAFRDRHVEQIQDYGMVGDTLWVFRVLRTRKVLLAQLGVPATTKVNADRGVDSQLPSQ